MAPDRLTVLLIAQSTCAEAVRSLRLVDTAVDREDAALIADLDRVIERIQTEVDAVGAAA